MSKFDPRIINVGEGEGLLSQKIIDREKTRLIKFYQFKLKEGKTSPLIKSDKDIVTSVNRSISRALKGFNRCSMKETPELSFVWRLRFLTRYDKRPDIWKDNELQDLFSTNKKEVKEHNIRAEKIAEARREERRELNKYVPVDPTELPEMFGGEFLELFDPAELNFYNRRKSMYLREFEFNSSSDLSLLEAVLSDEILLRRLTNAQLQGKKDFVDRNIDEIQKRLRETQKSLGVTRAQRVADDTNQKGNVAQLSESLDKKLQEIRNLEDTEKRDKIIQTIIKQFKGVEVQDLVFLAEELKMMRERALRPDMETVKPIPSINQIPDFVDIEKILRSTDTGIDE